MNAQANISAFTEAAAASVARAIADVKQAAAHQEEIRTAEHRAVMAEINTRLQAATDIERRLTERLASVKDGEPGASVSLDDVTPMIEEAVTRIASTIEPKGVDSEALSLLVTTEIERAVAALPPAEPGEAGKSVTLEDVGPMIAAAVEQAVAAFPPPEGVDYGEVERAVREEVSRAVAALPPAKAGEPGVPGKLPVVRAYADGVHYQSDVVTFDGRLYQARRDTGKEPTHEDWICLVERGTDGKDARTFRMRETWKAEEEYLALDVVALNGASFAARKDAPGACPGGDWQMIAAQGKRGAPGEVKRGDHGKPGSPVVDMTIDKDGLLSLKNGDGSVVTCDLYDLLANLGR